MGSLVVNGAALLALLWFNVFVVNYVAAREGVTFGKDEEEKTIIGGGKGFGGGFGGGFGKGGGIA